LAPCLPTRIPRRRGRPRRAGLRPARLGVAPPEPGGDRPAAGPDRPLGAPLAPVRRRRRAPHPAVVERDGVRVPDAAAPDEDAALDPAPRRLPERRARAARPRSAAGHPVGCVGVGLRPGRRRRRVPVPGVRRRGPRPAPRRPRPRDRSLRLRAGPARAAAGGARQPHGARGGRRPRALRALRRRRLHAGRVPLGKTSVVVRTYMAHHQGMVMNALGNAVAPVDLPTRFHADARVAAVTPVLYERTPLAGPLEKPEQARALAAPEGAPVLVEP